MHINMVNLRIACYFFPGLTLCALLFITSSYVGGAFLMDHGKIMKGKGSFRNDYIQNQHFMFHRVSNFKVYRHDAVEKKYHYKFAFAGQYDIVQMLGTLLSIIWWCIYDL